MTLEAILAGQDAARRVSPVGTVRNALAGPGLNDPMWKPIDGSLYPKATYSKLFLAIGQIYTFTDPGTTANTIDATASGVYFYGKVGAYYYAVVKQFTSGSPELWYATDPTSTWTKVSLTAPSYGTGVSYSLADIVFNGVEYIAMWVSAGNSVTNTYLALYKSTDGTAWATAGAAWNTGTATSSASGNVFGGLRPFSGGAYAMWGSSATTSPYTKAVKYTNGGTSAVDTAGVSVQPGLYGNAGAQFVACDGTYAFYGASNSGAVTRKTLGANTEVAVGSVSSMKGWYSLGSGAYVCLEKVITTTNQIQYTTDSFTTILTAAFPDLPMVSASSFGQNHGVKTIYDWYDDTANNRILIAVGYQEVHRIGVYAFNKTTYALTLLGITSVPISGYTPLYITVGLGGYVVVTATDAKPYSFGLDIATIGPLANQPARYSATAGLTVSYAATAVGASAGGYSDTADLYGRKGSAMLPPRYHSALSKVIGCNNGSQPSVRNFASDYDTVNYFRLPVLDSSLKLLGFDAGTAAASAPLTPLIKVL